VNRISKLIRTIIAALIIVLAPAASFAQQEELRLTTIMPTTDLVLRGIKGTVGRTWHDPAVLSDNAIPNGYLYIENTSAVPGGLRIGDHFALMDGQPGDITLANYGYNYFTPPVPTGMTGSINLGGVGLISDWERCFLGLSHNLWSVDFGTTMLYKTNGAAANMWLGVISRSDETEGGFAFQAANYGTHDSVINFQSVLLLRRSRIDFVTENTPSAGLYWNNGSTTQKIHAIFSDIRHKKDIITIPNALERIDSIRGVNFRWKDTKFDTSLHTGVIAQEVEKVFPELVHSDSKKMKTVSYEEFKGVLIESIKDLKKRNIELRRDLDLSEKEIDEQLVKKEQAQKRP